MEYISASNPRRVLNSILLDVVFVGIGSVQFYALPTDVEAYGRELYAKAEAGDFGEITPPIAP